MAMKIHEPTLKKAILQGVEQLVELSENAKGVEFTIAITKDAVPTISYKIDEMPILLERKGVVKEE